MSEGNKYLTILAGSIVTLCGLALVGGLLLMMVILVWVVPKSLLLLIPVALVGWAFAYIAEHMD